MTYQTEKLAVSPRSRRHQRYTAAQLESKKAANKRLANYLLSLAKGKRNVPFVELENEVNIYAAAYFTMIGSQAKFVLEQISNLIGVNNRRNKPCASVNAAIAWLVQLHVHPDKDNALEYALKLDMLRNRAENDDFYIY